MRRARSLAVLLAPLLLSACAGASHATTAKTKAPHVGGVAASRSAAAPRSPRLRASTVMHLPAGVSRSVVVALNGRLLVLGGLAAGDSTTARVWSVDVHRRTTSAAGTLAVAVHDASGAVLHGAAFVFGGGAATTVATVQEYVSGHSRVVGHLPQPRSDSAAAVIGDTAYVVGGFDGHQMVRDVLATTDGIHFRVVARLRVGVRYPAVVAVDRYLLVGGGSLATTEGTAAGAQSDAVQRVDTQSGDVTVVAHLPHGVGHAIGLTVGGLACVAGGHTSAGAASSVWQVAPVDSQVRLLGHLPRPVSDAGWAVLDGTTYLVGGETLGPGAPDSTVVALRLA